jgi:hypothetical protein
MVIQETELSQPSSLVWGNLQCDVRAPESAGAAKDSSRTSLPHTYVFVDGDTTHSASPWALFSRVLQRPCVAHLSLNSFADQELRSVDVSSGL